MAPSERVGNGDHRRGDGNADDGPDRPHEGHADEHRPEGHRWVDVHRPVADLGGQPVALELLVDRGEHDDPHGVERVAKEREQGGDDDTDVGANDRDELAGDPHEHPKGQPEGHVKDEEEQRVRD